MNMIGEVEPSEETLDTLETKVTWYTHVYNYVYKIMYCVQSKAWVMSFLSLPSLEGHKKRNVTPYIHILAKHVSSQMRSVRGIRTFSGQREHMYALCSLHINLALEENNDDARRNYRSSNKLDGGKEILLTDARQELLTDYERDVRKYTKSNTTY